MSTIPSGGVGGVLGDIQDARQAGLRPFANVDLTSSQRSQIQSIIQAARQSGSFKGVGTQIQAVLTPAQQAFAKADIAAAVAQFGNPQKPSGPPTTKPDPITPDQWAADVKDAQQAGINPYANLNLTADQQSQVNAILQNAVKTNSFDGVGAQLKAVLTPPQVTFARFDTAALLSQFGS